MSLQFRKATRNDLPAIVRLLADDVLGAKRERYETPLPESYLRAFESIDADPNNELVVACMEGEVVGVLQLTFIPYLAYQGGWRALIEAVRIDSSRRSQGLGKALFEWAIDRARERGCYMVQLTTDKARADAKRFYEALGFVASHEGMKLHLRERGSDPNSMNDRPAALRYMAPVFRVSDLARSVRFYREQLGFELDFVYEDLYACVQRGGCYIHLKCASPGSRDQAAFERAGHLDACAVISAAATLASEFSAAGAPFSVPLRTMPYGVEFYVRDPDGYIIGFVQPAT